MFPLKRGFSAAMPFRAVAIALLATAALGSAMPAQEYGPPDRGAPGDEMIQKYLARETEKTESSFLENIKSQEDWEKVRPRYKEEYFYMLGLWPLPEKTPLRATITGTLSGDGYVVDMLHYQSRPRLYVTGNLYRPATIKPGERLPAVFYVCGHTNQGRDGNKTAYQSHGIWFARHGYICLTVDTLQLGEIAGIHHGTYREGRWWWQSRGYTPAGVECWNGIRGIDYFTSRPDVDPERIAVTGISGGGAATFWIAAADEWVKVAVPVSGMADLQSYVTNRVINGHCDCMFLYNTFQWSWTRIAAMVAPRPMLFTNSDADRIFPMDANERVINRLKRVYSLYGAADMVDSCVSIGGHAYRKDIRQAAYRFINMHFKDDPRIVRDSETDIVTGEGKNKHYPIEPAKLRVFPRDEDLPADQLNSTIDQSFVPIAQVAPPKVGEFDSWKSGLQKKLKRVTFGFFRDRIPSGKLSNLVETQGPNVQFVEWTSEDDIRGTFHHATSNENKVSRIVLLLQNAGQTIRSQFDRLWLSKDDVWQCSLRGVGGNSWTTKNPPNYVERSHALLGRTVDTGRVWDIIAIAREAYAKHEGKVPVHVAGDGASGVLAAYAALWEPEIAGVIIHKPPLSHMDADAPALLNVLRVCDIPDVLGMIAPRPLTIYGVPKERLEKVAAIYTAAGAADKLTVKAE